MFWSLLINSHFYPPGCMFCCYRLKIGDLPDGQSSMKSIVPYVSERLHQLPCLFFNIPSQQPCR